MAQWLFEGKYKDDRSIIKVRLILIHFKDENNIHFIYSPHLDLTGYGRNMIEAKKSFEIALEDFIDYTNKKKTLGKVLSELGWTLKGSAKKPKKILAPSIKTVIGDNEYVSEIFDNYAVETFHQEVSLPEVI